MYKPDTVLVIPSMVPSLTSLSVSAYALIKAFCSLVNDLQYTKNQST